MTMTFRKTVLTSAFCAVLGTGYAHAEMMQSVTASDQDLSNGIISADTVMADQNGWLVIHRTDAEMKPGPVVGYAPLRKGTNADVAAILQEPAKPGDMYMLMIHSEDGGMHTGKFEYTLGAKEDGPVKPDGKLVMTVIKAM